MLRKLRRRKKNGFLIKTTCVSQENPADSYVFNWPYFTQHLTSFSSIDHLRLYARFLTLFHLT